MNWLQQTFDDFGRSIGVGPLPLGAEGGLSLRIGERQQLAFQADDAQVLVLLSQALPPGDALTYKLRALDRCHPRHGGTLAARAGLSRHGELVFMVSIPTRQFTLPVLEQSYEHLQRLHEHTARG